MSPQAACSRFTDAALSVLTGSSSAVRHAWQSVHCAREVVVLDTLAQQSGLPLAPCKTLWEALASVLAAASFADASGRAPTALQSMRKLW